MLPALAAALDQPHQPVVRVSFLSGFDTVIHEALPTGGGVQMDRTRDVPRNGSVVLADPQWRRYLPENDSSLLWMGRLLRIERGVAGQGYVPLMTGLLDEPQITEGSDERPLAVWGRLRLADRQFTQPVSFAPGTGVAAVLRSLAQLGGLGTTDEWYDLADGGQVLTADRTFDVADNILRSIRQLAENYALTLSEDALGRLVVRPFVDPSTVAPVWHFAAGRDAIMTELKRTLRTFQVFNRVVVGGWGADFYPIQAEAVVTNPLSPLFWTPANDLTAPPYSSTDIRDQQQASAVAVMRLHATALYEDSLASASVPVPGLEAGDVVRFTGAGVDDTYLLDSLSIPLGPGAMSMATRKIRSLVAA